LLSPQGERFTQAVAHNDGILAALRSWCAGRYKAIDDALFATSS
jgi:hypothetical protein